MTQNRTDQAFHSQRADAYCSFLVSLRQESVRPLYRLFLLHASGRLVLWFGKALGRVVPKAGVSATLHHVFACGRQFVPKLTRPILVGRLQVLRHPRPNGVVGTLHHGDP